MSCCQHNYHRQQMHQILCSVVQHLGMHLVSRINDILHLAAPPRCRFCQQSSAGMQYSILLNYIQFRFASFIGQPFFVRISSRLSADSQLHNRMIYLYPYSSYCIQLLIRDLFCIIGILWGMSLSLSSKLSWSL